MRSITKSGISPFDYAFRCMCRPLNVIFSEGYIDSGYGLTLRHLTVIINHKAYVMQDFMVLSYVSKCWEKA